MSGPRHGNAVSATLAALADLLPGRGGRGAALADEGRLDGRTCLVTGASSGLGKATAIELARRGAELVLACRSAVPGIADEIAQASGNRAVEALRVDLADLDSVGALCDALVARARSLDVVVLNAGVMPRSARPTAQGFELMFGVNFLANVLITRRLLAEGVVPNQRFAGGATPRPRARIVMVASEVHRSAAPLDFERFGAYVDYGITDGMKQYGHSKLAVCTYATELARRLGAGGDGGEVDVAVHALCPGPIRSNMAREAPRWVKPVLGTVMRLFFLSPERASIPVIHLAGAPELEGATGRYFHMTTEKRPSEQALDAAAGRRLWEASEHLLAGRL